MTDMIYYINPWLQTGYNDPRASMVSAARTPEMTAALSAARRLINPYKEIWQWDKDDVDGEIQFERLGIGVYTVTEFIPSGTQATTPASQIVTVSTNSTSTIFFGNAIIPGGLEVLVYEDRNGNGIQGAGETSLSDVLITSESARGQAESGLTADIAVLPKPFGVAVNPATRKVYVAHTNPGKVAVINMDTLTVEKVIDMGAGSEPTQIAVNIYTNRAYVTLHGQDKLTVIDGMNDRIITTITVGAGPFDVAVDEQRNQIFVSVRDAGYIAMIDGATNTELLQKRTFLGGNPFAINLSQQPSRLYVVYDPYTRALAGQFSSPVFVPAEVNPNKLAVFELKQHDLGLISRVDIGNGGPNRGIGMAFNWLPR